MPDPYLDPKYADEGAFTVLFKRCVKNAQTVIDVGAASGFYTKIANASGAQTFAYEPDPERFKKLLNTCKDFVGAHCFDAAISDVDGTAKFFAPGELKSGFLNSEGQYDVEVRALNTLHKGRKVDLIKVDTEGNELQVLKGASDLLRFGPDLFLETHGKDASLKEFVETFGYETIIFGNGRMVAFRS